MAKETATPFDRPLYVMAKPAGARCNLACRYCYYLPKAKLYASSAPHLMSDEVLELFTRQYIEAQTGTDVMFCWHGGEPLLRPLAFYRRALSLQERYGRGRRILNCLQTNGTLLTPEWAGFLHDNGWLVGLSIDGPKEEHDSLRRDRLGRPSWVRVRRAMDLLERHGVEWNAMATVNAVNARNPLAFYRFFRYETPCRYLQFAPIVEPGLASNVAPRLWGSFLCAIFDEWVRRDVGTMFVQLFDATLANWCGLMPGLCTLAPECGHAGVVEWNGDVYSCDHFVTPAHKLGNIRTETLTAMMHSPRQRAFGRAKREGLAEQCAQCEWLFACSGECPKNRDAQGLNVLCEGYRAFFAHAAPAMDRMKALLASGLPPADVMRAPLPEG